MPTMTFEEELGALRKEINRAETEGRALKAEVDQQRDDMLKRHKAALDAGEKSPLVDRDSKLFDEFDAKWKLADEKLQEAADLRHRERRLIEMAEQSNGTVEGSPKGRDKTQLSPREQAAFEQIVGRYTESDAYKRMVSSGQLKGSGHIHGEEVPILDSRATMDLLRTRTTVNVGDAGSVVPIDQQVWPPVLIPVRKIQLLDLVSMVTTDSDQVNWVKQTVRTDFAAETPYGTNAPEADYEFALQSVGIKRIPQMVPATKDVLADQGQLQGVLQDLLMVGVQLRLESQILAGAGTSPTDTQIQGMLNSSGIGVVTYQSSGHSAEYQLDAYHRAITTIRLTLFSDPTATVVSPVDYEWAVLKKDGYGRYLFDPNSEDDVRTLWGLNTVISPVISQGTGLTGDFKQAYRVWIREGISVAASTEHLDFFTRGMVALLATMRVGAATIQPRAICEVLGLTGP